MPSAIPISPRSLRERDAASYTGVSTSYLRNTRCADMRRLACGEPIVGPVWSNVGRSVVYLRDDLDRWLESGRVQEAA